MIRIMVEDPESIEDITMTTIVGGELDGSIKIEIFERPDYYSAKICEIIIMPLLAKSILCYVTDIRNHVGHLMKLEEEKDEED